MRVVFAILLPLPGLGAGEASDSRRESRWRSGVERPGDPSPRAGKSGPDRTGHHRSREGGAGRNRPRTTGCADAPGARGLRRETLRPAAAALAKRIHDQAVAILRGLTGRRQREVRFRMLPPEQYGFFASGTSVAYQNPFGMAENALRVNRAVAQAASRDELMRHAQMMLPWYVTHEVVHAFSDKSGWAGEFIANTIQPYLTARILRGMKDLPYTGRNMGWVYDRYVRVLRPLIAVDTVGRIDRFVRSEAKTPLYEGPVMDVFHRNIPEYVYFGARINQISWREETTLEKLVARYLG